MTAILWRVLMAAIAIVLVFLLIPAFADLLGFSIQPALMTIIKVCVAGIAVFYVLRGGPPTSA